MTNVSTTDNNQITIDKSIPIPAKLAGRWGVEKYPISKLDVGDSFYVQSIKGANFYARSKKLGIKVTVRKYGTGYRVWRTG